MYPRCFFIFPSIYFSTYSINPSIHQSIHQSFYRLIFLSVDHSKPNQIKTKGTIRPCGLALASHFFGRNPSVTLSLSLNLVIYLFMYVCIGIYLYIVRAILLHDTTSQIIGSRSGGGLPGGHVGGTWRANWFVVVRSSFVVRLHVRMDGWIPYDRYALELGLFETTVRSAHATSNKQTANSNRNKKGKQRPWVCFPSYHHRHHHRRRCRCRNHKRHHRLVTTTTRRRRRPSRRHWIFPRWYNCIVRLPCLEPRQRHCLLYHHHHPPMPSCPIPPCHFRPGERPNPSPPRQRPTWLDCVNPLLRQPSTPPRRYPNWAFGMVASEWGPPPPVPGPCRPRDSWMPSCP